MRLYHGSNIEINTIDLSKCRPFKDFGQGFYLTALQEQAMKMAKRVSRIYGGKPCTTIFEFNDASLQNQMLRTRIFQAPCKEWALFVINNRSRDFKNHSDSECNHDLKYDIVGGPIANDDLALLFRQFSNKLIDVDTLVKEMNYKKLTNQYSFHTANSLKYLKKEGRFYV